MKGLCVCRPSTEHFRATSATGSRAEHPTDKVLIVLEFGITNSIGDGYAVLVEMGELDKSQVPECCADSI